MKPYPLYPLQNLTVPQACIANTPMGVLAHGDHFDLRSAGSYAGRDGKVWQETGRFSCMPESTQLSLQEGAQIACESVNRSNEKTNLQKKTQWNPNGPSSAEAFRLGRYSLQEWWPLFHERAIYGFGFRVQFGIARLLGQIFQKWTAASFFRKGSKPGPLGRIHSCDDSRGWRERPAKTAGTCDSLSASAAFEGGKIQYEKVTRTYLFKLGLLWASKLYD